MRLLTAFTGMCVAFSLMLPLPEARSKDGAIGGQPAAPDARPSSPARGGAGGGGQTAPGSAPSPVGYTPNEGTAVYQPDLHGSSFQNSNSYYMWNNYYSYLSTSFDVNPVYFGRFYRNTEPLITPAMLKLTLREPVKLSSEMLDSIDRLQKMLEANHSGASADRKALVENSKHIRKLAKRIRNNQTLSCIDLRKNKNLYINGEHDASNPEVMRKLRGMAMDLDRQLRTIYGQSSTSTVSVESYKEPSLESLTKGIEKICKGIEAYSKRL